MNKDLLEKCGLAKWHEAGYTGKGIRVAVYDDRPFLTAEMKSYASIPQAEFPAETESHNTNVAKCLHEAAPDAEIFCLSALTTDNEKNADWIIANDIDLISSSFIPPPPMLGERFKKLKESGIVMCTASGNEGEDYIKTLAAEDWTITVGAADISGESKTSYSNYGTELDCLAYIPKVTTRYYPQGVRLKGTSFAQPFAAGMIACYMQYAKEQGLPHDRQAIKKFIAENCKDIYTEGKDNESGFGVLTMPHEIPQREVKEMQYQYPFKSHFVFGAPYGQKGDLWQTGWHSGLDLKSSNYGGDGRIYPIAEGTVLAVAKSDSYGNYVMVQHADGYISLYAHLQSVIAQEGQRVYLHSVLGIEGTTGNSTGVHLHLEIHKGEYSYPASIDPQAFIEERLYKESEEEHMLTKTKLLLNGVEKEVQTIQHEGHNYIKLRDLVDDRITVDYDAAKNLPILEVRDK